MPTISLFLAPTDNVPKRFETTWEDLARNLSECEHTECLPCKGHDCEAKQGRGWSPVEYAEGATRGNEGVVAITFGVFDLDATTPEAMATLAGALDGHAYLCHQTHSGNGWRLVVPFTRPVPVDSWGDVWPALVARFRIPADPHRKDPGGIYFTPTRPKGAEYKVYTGIGKPVDVDNLDLVLPAGVAGVQRAFKESLQLDAQIKADPHDARNYRQGPVDLEEMRTAMRGMRKADSRDLMDAILGGRRLTEKHPTDVGHRDSEILRATGVLATLPATPYPADTVIALLEPSIRAMDCSPEGLQYWLDAARHKYVKAVGQRLERDVRADADRTAMLKILGMDTPPGDDNWRRALLYMTDPKGMPAGLRQIGANVNLILENDPVWKDTLRFNEVTKEIDVFGGPAAAYPKACLDVEVANWMARSEYKLYVPSHIVREQLLAVARKHCYDPIRDWLMSLKWDGVPRISSFFREVLGATGDQAHNERISRCFLISMAARGLDPGCDVHTVPILQGPQGCGKSRSLKALGGEHFTDTKLKLSDKDSKILTAESWLIELSELASIRNADVDEVKSFVSQAFDKIRPPYGHVKEVFLRRCVFVGTTNPDDFLNDWTGNRRWWPITVTQCDVERVTRERNQLLAEAVVAYQKGEKWYLDKEYAERAEEIALGYMRKSVRSEQVLQWFATKNPNQRPSELTSFEIANTIFGVPMDRVTRAVQMEVGAVCSELKFERKRKRMGERLMWVYSVPDDILQLVHNAKPQTPLDVVEGEKDDGTETALP